MVTDLQVLFAVQLFIIFLIVFDSMQKREWMSERKLILIVLITVLVPVLGAIIYIAVVRRHERRVVPCPECGGAVQESEDSCPHCGFDPAEKRRATEGPHRCGACGREFDTARGLMQHRSREHRGGADGGGSEEDTTETDQQPYTCPDCGATFDSKRGLHVHQSVKHG